MSDPHEFLRALTVVLCVAALTTVLFQRLRQPVILGYILAGLIVGPHVPVPLVADSVTVRTLAEIGVILLMFSLGLEFSLRKLGEVGPTAAMTAVVETSLMLWFGFNIAQLFGWTLLESLFLGAVIAISSTTIVAKAFQEQGVAGRLRERVVGILIVEDLIAILLLAALTAIASGSGLAFGPLLVTVGKLGAFLAGLIGFGLLLIPRAVRLVNRLNRPETTIVAAVGSCFALALLAQGFGYSAALGAFLAGSLIAESGEAGRIERLVEPVRDIFAAVFFVSVGMLIDPGLILRHWGAILVLTGVVIGGKIGGVALGSFLTGSRLRIAIQSGMSLAQIGEFSFIIAGLGLTLGATGDFLYPVAIAVSALTTLTTPWLIRASGPVADWVDRHLPGPLQTFTVLYGSWVEGLLKAPRSEGNMAQLRRLLRRLLLDAAVCSAILVGFYSSADALLALARDRAALPDAIASPLLLGIALLLAAPFFFGTIRVGRKLGQALAEMVLPAGREGRVDLAAAPRRLLVVSFELLIVFLVGAPLLVLTRPFVPGIPGILLLALFVTGLGVLFWRSATNLQGHVQAGTEVIIEALARQAKGGGGSADRSAVALQQVEQLLPGLGALTAVRLKSGSPAVGRSLAELNLRALSGASVLGITRKSGAIIAPTASEVLNAGDLLALTGTSDAVALARTLLEESVPAEPPAEN
ncbi:cation:proton antiporter [Desulfuromonas carbonis]